MARFQVGDTIELVKFRDAIRRGVVVKGPWNEEKVDHYHVKWEWDVDGMIGRSTDLICDLASTKYHYRIAN
jgi:hypothetical protein